MTSGQSFARPITLAHMKSVRDWRFGWFVEMAGKVRAMKQKSLAEGLWRWLACDTRCPTLMSMRKREKKGDLSANVVTLSSNRILRGKA